MQYVLHLFLDDVVPGLFADCEGLLVVGRVLLWSVAVTDGNMLYHVSCLRYRDVAGLNALKEYQCTLI